MQVSILYAFVAGIISFLSPFLLQHKSLMGPVAGAVIILFGLHLVGWLIKLPVNAGFVIGGVLAVGAAILWRRLGTETVGPGGLIGSVQLLSVALIFLAGPSLTRWLNRDAS